jgi:hypothetical protein
MTTTTLEEILRLETGVWSALAAGDAVADAALLAEDFLGVYPTGFAARSDHTGQLLGGPTVAGYELTEVRLVELSADVVLLAYRARFVPAAETAPRTMYVSSVWQRRDGRWRNVFSQDTPAQD